MRKIQWSVRNANASTPAKDQATLHAADGIHLSDLGQLAMAFAILKGLGRPRSLGIDRRRRPQVVAASGAA